MSWVIYLKFPSIGNFVLIELLTLNYISAYFWNAIWLLYQLIIHACSEANFRENNFTAIFSSVSVFQCEAFGRSPLEFRLVRLRWPDGQVTRPDARGFIVWLCGIPRSDGLVMCPDGYPTGVRIAFFSSRCIFLLFSRFLSNFLVLFSHVFSRVLTLFCPLVHFISFLGILLHLLHYFQFYLTMNLFNILEYILR
jgi:hypothetical protein